MLKWVQFLSIDQINFYICNSGLNISPRHLAILCQKVGLYAVLWSILILYDCNFISSMHCPLDVFNHFHQVENHIVGAPCGVMDQMASACGEANKLLAMICQVCIIRSYQKQYFLFFRHYDGTAHYWCSLQRLLALLTFPAISVSGELILE